MFGGEKDPDNGDKVDVIVEVYQPSPLLACTVLYFTVLYCTSQYCTVHSARCAVTAAWSREAWPGCGRGAWRCWWAAVDII